MTIDAAELREIAREDGLSTDEILALIEELEKGQAERARRDAPLRNASMPT